MHPSLILLITLAVSCVAAADPAVLADRGNALMPIVVSKQASQRQHELASELAGHLERISGAEFEVTAGNASAGIVLGITEQFPMPKWREALAIRGWDGREAYGIRTSTRRVLCLGSTDEALDRAITHLLEEIGCRWFSPNPAWHIVPKLDRVTVDLDLTERPALIHRLIWWDGYRWDGQVTADFQRWIRRNRMGGGFDVRCGHAWQRILRKCRGAFHRHPKSDMHPEYRALQAIERGTNKFCVSNPGLVRLCKRYAIERLTENPELDMVSMEPSDGGGHCQCAQCRAIGPANERVHWLTNEVAKAVAQACPGKLVGSHAYSFHSEPPSFKMEPNVYVDITAGFTRGRFTFLELIDEWAKHVRNLGIYEYLGIWAWNRDLPGAPRGANLAYLAERIPYYIERGARSMRCESGTNYAPSGLGYLVASRLMWDPEANVQAICDDFYQRAFGPAADTMRGYYERFDGGNRPLVGDHLLALAHRDLAEASRLAAHHSEVLRRLDDLKLYLHYVGLIRELDATPDGQARLDVVYRILNFAYRTRHRYIVHSSGIRGRSEHRMLLGKMKQPEGWNWRKLGDKTAWYVGGDYTHEETERIFQEGLARHAVQQFQERVFGGELVRAGLGPAPDAAPEPMTLRRSHRFAMLSEAGEPLAFRLLTGLYPQNRHMNPTRWQVTDVGGDEIASGRLPLDGEWHDLSVPVPRPGQYCCRVWDGAGGWGVDCGAAKPFVWAPERGDQVFSVGKLSDVYFYVPIGTRKVAYYVEGSDHRLLDAAGREMAQVASGPANTVLIPVPKGSDGQAWRIRGLASKRLWLLNCPNHFATRSENLLIPRELAER